jgi:hypothetical protein
VWGGPPPCCRDRLLIACDRCQDAFRLVRFWRAALVCRCSRTTSSTMSRRGSAGCSQQRQAHHDGASHTCGGDSAHGVHTRKPCSLTRGDSGTTPRYFGMQNKATRVREFSPHEPAQGHHKAHDAYSPLTGPASPGHFLAHCPGDDRSGSYSGRFGRVAAALACRSARVRVVGRNWTLPQRRCRPLPPHAGHCRCA